MKKIGNNAQNGYVLLILLLSLMAMGGVAIEGYTQAVKREVDTSRFNHNKQVLEQAKQALLMYAYRYPEIASRGPGRLPCPDMNDSGTPNPWTDCIGQISGDAMVGRFPWATNGLEFYDARDADGEELWYAVSASFSNFNPGSVINSNTIGTITLFDQSGEIIYDGALGGIAAVIIAPGAAQKRDDDGNGTYEFTQLRATGAQQTDPKNYLERFGNFDNSLFINSGINDTDGFILGPIYDDNVSEFVVNDQLIVVTTEEVIAMAQKSVLQSYQEAINNYRDNIGVDAYPWLDDYATQVTVLDDYDGDVGTRLGRVPSLFADYFVAGNPPADSEAIRSELIMDLKIDENNDAVYDFEMTETVPASVAPDVFFKEVVNGNLSTSFNSGYSFTRFFWDGHDFQLPSAPADGIWVLCPVVTGTEEDCNQNGAGNYIGGILSVDWMKVRRVTVTFDNLLSPFEFPFSDKMATPLAYAPPTAANHATVTAEYNNNSAYLNMVWSQDNDFQSDFTEFPAGNNGNFSIDIGWDSFTVGMIYYPVLPDWALATENDWHDSIQLVYADAYEPGNAAVNCTPAPPALPGNDCITVANSSGTTNNKIAVLAIAAEHNLVDDLADGFDNDLADIFDPENDNSDDIFAVRVGNDVIQVVR